MSPTKLIIPKPAMVLPTCTPNLMPFHINYTGPATVSAFMRVEKLVVEKVEKEVDETDAKDEASAMENATQDATKDVEMASDAQDSSHSTAKLSADKDPETMTVARSESQTTIAASESQTPSILSASSSLATLAPATPPSVPLLEDADKRFVSSFRGRTIHGLSIDLPAGFGGLVLQTKPQSQGADKGAATHKPNAKGKAAEKNAAGKDKEEGEEKEGAPSTRRRGRLTRSALTASKPTKPIEISDNQDELMADATAAETTPSYIDTSVTANALDAETAAVRRLVPAAQFSTFTLWQADRVVDKGRDEYYRSLTEWVALANEIHCVD